MSDSLGPFLGATLPPQSLAQDRHLPSAEQPSSMISPDSQSRTAHTGVGRSLFTKLPGQPVRLAIKAQPTKLKRCGRDPMPEIVPHHAPGGRRVVMCHGDS